MQSDQARQELRRAGCAIHKEVPGLDDDIEIVELQHDGDKDLNIMFVWDVPREIQIASRNLYLLYIYNEHINGYELSAMNEEEQSEQEVMKEYNDSLDDLEECRFFKCHSYTGLSLLWW